MNEQQRLILLMLKITVISGLCSCLLWITVYSYLASWWRNAIGQTLVIKTLLICGLLAVAIPSMFFSLSLPGQEIVGWIDVALIGAITPVLLWRTAVWIKIGLGKSSIENVIGKKKRSDSPEQ